MIWRKVFLDALDGLQLAVLAMLGVFAVMILGVSFLIILQGTVWAVRWIFGA